MLSYAKILTGIAAICFLNLPLETAIAQSINNNSEIVNKMMNIEGKSWRLIGLVQKDQMNALIPETTITLEFQKDRFWGTGGCNRYNGGFKREDNQFTVTPIASTQMACLPDVMQQEFQYFEILNSAQTYDVNEKGQLEIKGSKGILIFESQKDLNDAKSWLDQEKPQNWNKAGDSIPKAPNEEEGNNLEFCQEQIRKPSVSEDNALIKAGWTLFGAIQVYGQTSIISAMTNTDGMCRPINYQKFVFVEGQFAGTLSPIPMFSRGEGSAFNTYLISEKNISTEFNRYTDKDALCCPSGRSMVSYIIEYQQGKPVVIPQSVYTSKN